MNTNIQYSLRNKTTGKLIGVEISSNEGGSCCGEFSYRLSSYADNEWFVDTIEELEKAIAFDTPWYNSEHNRPQHGDEDFEEYEPVEVVRTINPVTINVPTVIKTNDEVQHLDYDTDTKEELLVALGGVNIDLPDVQQPSAGNRKFLFLFRDIREIPEGVVVGNIMYVDDSWSKYRVLVVIDYNGKAVTNIREFAGGVVLERI